MKFKKDAVGHTRLNDKDQNVNQASPSNNPNRWIKRHKERINLYKRTTFSVLVGALLIFTNTSCEKIDFSKFMNDPGSATMENEPFFPPMDIFDTIVRSEPSGILSDPLVNLNSAE